jgi:hypothetical protein
LEENENELYKHLALHTQGRHLDQHHQVYEPQIIKKRETIFDIEVMYLYFLINFEED